MFSMPTPVTTMPSDGNLANGGGNRIDFLCVSADVPVLTAKTRPDWIVENKDHIPLLIVVDLATRYFLPTAATPLPSAYTWDRAAIRRHFHDALYEERVDHAMPRGTIAVDPRSAYQQLEQGLYAAALPAFRVRRSKIGSFVPSPDLRSALDAARATWHQWKLALRSPQDGGRVAALCNAYYALNARIRSAYGVSVENFTLSESKL